MPRVRGEAPFAGVFYPISTLPNWMQFIARALPPSYVFEGMRALVAHRTVSIESLVLGGAIALLYVALAAFFFVRVYRSAVDMGLIARYSAESVS